MNTTEQLQSFLQQFINRIIKEDFKDIDEIPIEALDVNIPRHAIKLICIHNNQDSLLHTIVRILIYSLFVYLPTLISEGYFIPYVWLHENLDFIPQIHIHFMDDPASRSIRNKNKPLKSEITIRLHNIDIKEVSARREIEILANRILLNFRNFKYTKGHIKYTYKDTVNKLTTWSFFASKSEARDLFKNLCLVLGIIFDDSFIIEHFDTKNYSIPERRRVLGQTYEIERRRAGVVEFRNAVLHIQGVRPIKIVDRINTYPVDYIQTFYE